jgi:hypothetical protein
MHPGYQIVRTNSELITRVHIEVKGVVLKFLRGLNNPRVHRAWKASKRHAVDSVESMYVGVNLSSGVVVVRGWAEMFVL